MKNVLLGFVILTSMPSFSADDYNINGIGASQVIEALENRIEQGSRTGKSSQSSYCQGRGQEAIDYQKELILANIAEGQINEDLQFFSEEGVKEMQANHDYLCKGIRISNSPELTVRERQLSLISQGLASGDINEELADFLIQSLRNQLRE